MLYFVKKSATQCRDCHFINDDNYIAKLHSNNQKYTELHEGPNNVSYVDIEK